MKSTSRSESIETPVPAETWSPQPALPSTEKQPGFRWGLYIGAFFVILFGAYFLSTAIFDSSTRPPITGGGRGRALGELLRAMFGARGEEACLAIFALSIGIGLAFASLRGAALFMKIIGTGGLVLSSFGIFSIWALVSFFSWQETAWQAEVATKIRPMLDPKKESDSEPLPDVRDKLLVWDYLKKGVSPVQAQLPAGRRASSADQSMTLILILASREKQVTMFTGNIPGHERTLTVAAVNWPERKLLGIYPVRGAQPGLFVSRPAGDKGPIVGDTDQSLLSWITEAIPREQKLRAELDRIQGTWLAVRCEPAEPDLDPQKNKITLTIKDKNYTRQDQAGRFRINGMLSWFDPLATPQAFGVIQTDKGNQGWAISCIYAVDGDTLSICEPAPGFNNRPTDLKGGPTSRLIVYKRP
jgi:uncharacterized protein (TIGR03067 family)